MKKRVLLLTAIVALIAGAGIAYAASSTGGLPGGEPAVWGGGHFTFVYEGQGYGRDFSIVATPDGGQWLYGLDGSGPRIVGHVTCMRVSGSNAVIGGIIREAQYTPDYVGMAFVSWVTDNGMLASTPDQASAAYVGAPRDLVGWAGITKSFPYVCPPFSAKPGDVPMYDLESGDIVVQNATQNSQQ